MPITKINPDTLPDAGALGYTQTVTAKPGELVFCSGQVAIDRDGTPVPSDLAEQAKVAANNVKLALAAAGATPEDVTIVRLYIVDMTPEKMEAVGSALPALFKGTAPCATAIGVQSLADPEYLVEIEVMAVKA
ncbi:RidA family protein [Parasphingopyxis sp.]|uniref:RidA family protein n=1 Tax=Parasphingopyxis sp. TaxID=1920299 RepID=UPI00261842A0|nr:RidA family protein [Parasphingopyxis sp.]